MVYRRTDEDRLTDEHGRLTAVGAALYEPLRAGTLTCVNGFGTGVADDKLVHAYVDGMIRFYLRRGAAAGLRAHLRPRRSGLAWRRCWSGSTSS